MVSPRRRSSAVASTTKSLELSSGTGIPVLLLPWEVLRSSRSLALAVAIAVLVGAALLAALGSREGIGTAPATPITTSTPADTVTAAARSVAPATGVLDERFGFLVYDREATVRSETSDAVISSFAPKVRSFTSESRVISPDGRFVAYWDPVDNGAVLHVRSVTGGSPRSVLTGRPEMSGNAFTWSYDGGGLVAELESGSFGIPGPPPVSELWTVDLASGATEKIASAGNGSVWLPVTWDRGAKLVATGVTGEGGYLTGYDVIDLRQQPYVVRSTPFRPTIQGRLKASSDARYILLTFYQAGSNSLEWWPLAEPDRRSAVAFDAIGAEWRPGTSEIWWVDGRTPLGCQTAPCTGTELVAFDVVTGARRLVLRGSFGATLVGFRVDGSAAITEAYGSMMTVIAVDVRSGRTASVPLSGRFGAAVRLR